MTRSVTIVNTSNWDNEPCLVNGTLLQVGEQITLAADKETNIKVEPIATLAPIMPFGNVKNRTEGHIPQVMPEVRVRWVEGGGMIREADEVSDRAPDE